MPAIRSDKGASAFKEYLPFADALPSAPRVLPRLLGLLSDADADLTAIVDLIALDPGLTSQLLRLCNSALIGLPEPASDVGEAVNRLGVSAVYQLAAAVCGASAFSGGRNALGLEVWQHSVTSAFAADMLATDLGLDRGSLFTAALLHDIGKMVLEARWQEDYRRLIEETRAEPFALAEKEKEVFSLDHGELGGRLLAHWKFPAPIASSVWKHHFPALGIPFERETACVTLSELLADAALQSSDFEALCSSPGLQPAVLALKLHPDGFRAYISRTQENFEFVNAVCQIGS